MKHNRSLEDYLEGILLLSRENEFVHRVDVARKIGVSQPAVQKAVKLLQSQNLVEFDGMHLYLTSDGETYAYKIYERHCTIRKFLKLIGVNEGDADTDACELEHIVSDETYKMMKKFVEDKSL